MVLVLVLSLFKILLVAGIYIVSLLAVFVFRCLSLCLCHLSLVNSVPRVLSSHFLFYFVPVFHMLCVIGFIWFTHCSLLSPLAQ